MGTVTRTFEITEQASVALDAWASDEQCEPEDVLNTLVLMFADGEVRDDDFTPEQWEMIHKGEADADAGRFASQEEIDALFNRYISVS